MSQVSDDEEDEAALLLALQDDDDEEEDAEKEEKEISKVPQPPAKNSTHESTPSQNCTVPTENEIWRDILRRQLKNGNDATKSTMKPTQTQQDGNRAGKRPRGNDAETLSSTALCNPFDMQGTCQKQDFETQEDRDFTEPCSRLRIKKRLVSTQQLADWLLAEKYYSVSSICRKVSTATSADELKSMQWCTLAVVTSVSETFSSSAGTAKATASLEACSTLKSYKYQKWWIRDFQSDQEAMVLLYGRAWEAHWKSVSVGTVVFIRNGRWLHPGDNQNSNNNNGSLQFSNGKSGNKPKVMRIDYVEQIRAIGVSMDWGYCQAVRRDGQRCRSVVDVRATDYCSFHITQAPKKARVAAGKAATAAEKHAVLKRAHDAPIDPQHQQIIMPSSGAGGTGGGSVATQRAQMNNRQQVLTNIPVIGAGPGQFLQQPSTSTNQQITNFLKPAVPSQRALVDHRGLAISSNIRTVSYDKSGKIQTAKAPKQDSFAAKMQIWNQNKKAGASMFNKGSAALDKNALKPNTNNHTRPSVPPAISSTGYSMHRATTKKPIPMLTASMPPAVRQPQQLVAKKNTVIATTTDRFGDSEELELTEMSSAQEYLGLDRQNSTVTSVENQPIVANHGPHDTLIRAEKVAREQKKNFKPIDPNKYFVKSVSAQDLEKRKQDALVTESLRNGESLDSVDTRSVLEQKKKQFNFDDIYGELGQDLTVKRGPRPVIVNRAAEEQVKRDRAFQSKASLFGIDVTDEKYMKHVKEYGTNDGELLTDAERREVKRQLDAAEGAERTAEYLENHGRSVTVFRCRQCNQYNRQKPDICREQNHQFENVQTQQFQLQCANCKKFAVGYACDKRPQTSCPHCQGLLRKPSTVQQQHQPRKNKDLQSSTAETNLGRIGRLF